jgi:hypothetical protein
VSENRRLSTIGSEGWLLTIIVLRSAFLAGPSIGRAQVETARLRMNFLTLLLLGLVIQIQESEPAGRRVNGWQNSSRIAEPCWFWTA